MKRTCHHCFFSHPRLLSTKYPPWGTTAIPTEHPERSLLQPICLHHRPCASPGTATVLELVPSKPRTSLPVSHSQTLYTALETLETRLPPRQVQQLYSPSRVLPTLFPAMVKLLPSTVSTLTLGPKDSQMYSSDCFVLTNSAPYQVLLSV